MTPPAPPLIDCHAHAYIRGMPLADDAWHRPQADASIEDYLETLKTAGVRYGVLAAASLFGDYNDYSIAACRRHPNIRATVIVDPSISRQALEAMKADGAVGIRLQLMGRPRKPDLAAPDYQRLLASVRDLDWHVELHDYGRELAPVIAAIEAAGVKLVIDHFGRPLGCDKHDVRAFETILAAVSRGRTWVKVSADFRLKPPALAHALMPELLAGAGAERLLWGSDWPFAGFEGSMTYSAALDSYFHLAADPKVRRAIDETGLEFYFGDRMDLIRGLPSEAPRRCGAPSFDNNTQGGMG